MKRIYKMVFEKIRRILTVSKREITKLLLVFSMVLLNMTVVSADGLESSVLVTGTQNLINSAMNVILVIAPIAGGLIIAYLCIRRAMSDEQEHKMWNKRISIALVSTIGAVVASVTINMILSYFR